MEATPQIDSQRKTPNKAARIILVVGIVAIVAVTNWITNGTGGGTIKPGENPSVPPPVQLPYPAKEIHADAWMNTGNKPVSIKSLKGRIILLEFWRHQCHICRDAIPMVKELEKKYASKGVATITIHTAAVEEQLDISELKEFVKKYQMTLPIAVDNRRKTMQDYRLDAVYPTFVIINRKGNVIEIQGSAHSRAILENDLKALLAGKDLEQEAREQSRAAAAKAKTGIMSQPVGPPESKTPGAKRHDSKQPEPKKSLPSDKR